MVLLSYKKKDEILTFAASIVWRLEFNSELNVVETVLTYNAHLKLLLQSNSTS